VTEHLWGGVDPSRGCIGNQSGPPVDQSRVSEATSEAHSDRAARFHVLYDEAYARMMAYAMRRVASRQDAEDVVSEVFTIAWRRLEEIPIDARRLPWMYGAARRTLANHYRGRDRKERLVGRLRHEPPPAGQSYDAVHEALDRLRPDDREMLTLNAWDDLDTADIALALGIPAATAAVRLHRARRRLARELERLGVKKADDLKSEGDFRTPGEVKGHSGEVTRE